MNSNIQKNKTYLGNEDDPIEFKSLVGILLRNKLIISSATALFTIITIIYSQFLKPIYRGSFDIVIEKDSSSLNLNPIANLGLNSKSNRNQKYILQSSSVLKPVYNSALSEYEKRKDKGMSGVSYKFWKEGTLTILFEDNTDVLNVAFKDSDKDFIIRILNQISKTYQNYTMRVKERELKNLIKHLQKQELTFREKALNSQKELNKFSIENGLGDIDGFVSLGESNIDLNLNEIKSLISNNNMKKSLKNFTSPNESKAGQRFSRQFSLLEKYEADFTNYSSKLKPDSLVLKNLKVRIDNLRSALKRPNEILVRYQELIKSAQIDEDLLANITEEKLFAELDLARQKNPWIVISEPTIDDNRIYPNRTQMTLFAFIFSGIFSFLIVFIKEKISGRIYELSDLIKYIDTNLLETIYLKNKSISNKIFKSLLENYKKEINLKQDFNDLAIIDFSDNNNLIRDFLDLNSDYFFNDIEDKKLLGKDKIFLIISKQKITIKDCLKINKYLNIFKGKIQGWVFLDEKTEI